MTSSCTDRLEQAYVSSTTPIGPPTEHYLNLVSKHGYHKRSDASLLHQEAGGYSETLNPAFDEGKGGGEGKVGRESRNLYVTAGIMSIDGIDPVQGTFRIRIRLYIMWRFDAMALLQRCPEEHKVAFSSIMDSCSESDHYVSLCKEEIKVFCEVYGDMPSIRFMNAIMCEEADDWGIRLYGRGEETAVMYNQMWDCELKEHFELDHFPFDFQSLHIELKQDDPRTWDQYALRVHGVLFKREALEFVEWFPLNPRLEHGQGSMLDKSCKIDIQLQRIPWFFLRNIVLLQLMLSLLALTAFLVPASDIADRMSIILTILLTSVAFKFVIADVLPRLPYDTFIDNFLMLNMCMLFVCALSSALTNIGAFGFERDLDGLISTLAFYGIGLLVWCVRVFQYVSNHRSERKQQHIKISSKVTWYHFLFGNPFFLPPPPS
mmetsp:Transcript_1385/g.5129  ORF Transcript_1385/g.5129 Transcript_1385/m.5129 type:complete len:433 (-) Transcript_1385:109-1407(-)